MTDCDECGTEVSMPYSCGYCGGRYCSEHRLPENHSCDGLSSGGTGARGKLYEDPSAPAASSGSGFSLPSVGLGGSLGRYEGSVTYVLLAIMVVVYLLQLAVLATLGPAAHAALFTLHPANLQYVWTWFTSIFSHSPVFLAHILFNGIVLFFFGTVLERKIGSKRFLALFVFTGVAAGLGQALSTMALEDPGAWVGSLGASGAIMGVLGTLTVLRPGLKVYLWFFIPMPLWFLTIAFALYDLLFLGMGGAGAGGVARVAHLSGLALGLLYGWKLRRDGMSMRSQIQLGGGGGPGGMGGRRGPPPRR